MSNETMTYKQAAEYLDVTDHRVRRLVADGTIKRVAFDIVNGHPIAKLSADDIKAYASRESRQERGYVTIRLHVDPDMLAEALTIMKVDKDENIKHLYDAFQTAVNLTEVRREKRNS